MTETAKTRVKDFSSQSLANTAWAIATIGHAASVLFDAFAEVATSWHEDFYLRSLANTAWAFDNVGHTSVAEAYYDCLKHFNSHGNVYTAWTSAQAGHASPAPFDAIKHFICCFAHVISQNLANTTWAYASRLKNYDSQHHGNTSHPAETSSIVSFRMNAGRTRSTYISTARRLKDTCCGEGPHRLRPCVSRGWVNLTQPPGREARVLPCEGACPEGSGVQRKRASVSLHCMWSPSLLPGSRTDLLEKGGVISFNAVICFEASSLEHGMPLGCSSGHNCLLNFNSQSLANTVWAFTTLGHTLAAPFDANRSQAFGSRAVSLKAWRTQPGPFHYISRDT